MEMMSTLKDHSMIMPSSNKQIVFPHVMSNKSRKCYLVVNCTMGGSAGRVSRQKEWEESLKVVVVDYDEGKHEVKTEVRGLGKEEVPKRYRKRLKEGLGQHDWTISQVVAEVLKLEPHGDIDNLLNHWAGRFHRKNFPILILGLLNEAELVLSKMKVFGCLPNVITYTTLIHAYGMAGMWEKAHSLFGDMESSGIEPDAIACSTLMSVFNRGGQPEKVLSFAERMKEKYVTFNEATYFEIIAACSKLRDWKTANEIVKEIEPSLANLSIGLVNHLLRFIGKSGKVEGMMKILNWLESSSMQPPFKIYKKILNCLEKEGNMEYIALVCDKMKKLRIQENGTTMSKQELFSDRGIRFDGSADINPYSPI